MTTYKPGDKALLKSRYYASASENHIVPIGTIGEYSHSVQTRAGSNFPTHMIRVGNSDPLPFFDNEIEPFEEDQFDTEGVTAAKNIAYEALDHFFDHYHDMEAQGLNSIEIADRIIEDLKAAGVVFPDSIKDPHAFTEEQK